MTNKQHNTNLESRDLISIAIFSVLFTICLFFIAGIMSILPVTMIFYGVVGGIPCGIIYMYMRAKTPKPGAIILQAVLTAAILFLMGTMWTFALGTLIGGMLAEMISASGRYKSFWKNTIGYIIFMACLWAGQIAPMILAKSYYMDYVTQTGMSGDYVNTMLSFLSFPMFMTALAATGLGSFLGALLGR